MMLKRLWFVFLIAAMAGNAWSDSPDLRITDAWVRAGPPGVMALAGYMRLDNSSSKAVKVLSVSSPQFGMIELHRTIIENGVARMVGQEYLMVPANGSLRLRPNDWHLMLMMPKSPLSPGDEVTLKLTLDDGRSITVKAPVKTHE